MKQPLCHAGMVFVILLLGSQGFFLSAQTVTGKVTDAANGEPLVGVSILIPGTSTGTITDLNGMYSIDLPETTETLVFSYTGFATRTITLNGQTIIDVELQSDVAQLEEIVVVGYGTNSRKNITGAVSSVAVEEVEDLPLTSVEQMLQGRVAGVQVTQSGGGKPGGALSVQIRGIGTVGQEPPLYVIDGVPIQAGEGGQLGTSILNSLNPNEIESIDILKDASAAAIYGIRASGGVVLITTKRGKEGPVRISLDAYTGLQSQNQSYDVLNADQYVQYLRDIHSGPDGQLPEAFVNGQPPHDTDWQDELFETASISNINLNLSGGSKNAVFSAGMEYFDQNGTMVGSAFERFSLKLNSDFKLGKRLKIGESLIISKTNTIENGGSGGRRPQEHAIKQAPTVPVLDDSFLGGFGHPDVDEGQDARNPIADAQLLTNENTVYAVLGSIYGELELLRGLTYKIQVGLDFRYGDFFDYNPLFEQVRRLRERSSLNWRRSENFNPIFEQYLTYNRIFGQHNLTVLAGYSSQSFKFTQIGGSGQDLPNNTVISLGATAANNQAVSNQAETSLRSVFGRLNYNFANRYLLTANIRREESSKLFRSGEPVGYFPSVSAAWRVSEEPFLRNNSLISELKIRGGWGQIGNQSTLSNFPTDVNLNTNVFYVIGGEVVQGIAQLNSANPNIQWEVSTTTSLGVDLGLLNNRLTMSFDYYRRVTDDLIWRASVPGSFGFGAPSVNAGEVRNSGVELVLGYTKTQGDFQYSISANLTTINNEMVSLGQDGLTEIITGGITDDLSGVSITRPGEPIGSFYGWETAGIFQSQAEIDAHAEQSPDTAPGDFRFVDQNNDGVINGDDRTTIGSPIPDFIYGLTANLNYKGFDLQIFLQGAQGHEIYNAAQRWLEDLRQNFNQGTAVLNRWSGPGSSNTVPRATRSDPNQNLRSSDRFVHDGSYLRIKNLTLGYNFPESLTEKLKASRLRAYVSAQNLATITDYFGLEPEVGSLSSGTGLDAGLDRLVYPQPTTVIFGLQLGF